MSEQDKPVVEERENGPLIFKNVETMTGRDGEPVETRKVMALCRCGGSGNKPFCDGTHEKKGFRSRGGEPAGRDRLIAYERAEITVSYNPRTCSHAAECNRLAPHVFDAAKRPWIEPDAGTVAEIEAVVAACPSGALAIRRPDGTLEHRLAERARITVQPDGPYWVQGMSPPGPLPAEGASSRKFVLCRCGLSGNKPYCDGSHRDAGWTDGG